MKSTTSAILGLAGLISSVAGHGFITSPPPRQAGTAMGAVCGQQMLSNQASDTYGNIQGELQVAGSDFQPDACNVWLCKGFQFDDNKSNVQTFTAGQVVPITVDIRAPHTGVANVSIVKTSSNSVIGSPLISFDEYASNSSPIPDSQKKFDITIPSDLGSECANAGDCVIQWYWDARSIDQTYESCIDFTVGSSGNSPAPAPSSSASPSAPAATSAAPRPTRTARPTPTSAAPVATASATAAPAPVPTGGAGNGNTLPQTFTLDTFIAWLQEVGKSSTKKARSNRKHARAF